MVSNLQKRILLVDDEPSILDVCKRYLVREGYEVITGIDGKEALELWEDSHFDLIILDLMMPSVDGLKVCEQIRLSDETPIIFLTAKREEYDRIIGLTIGANDYITKPFNPRELVLRVNAIFRLLDFGKKPQEQTEQSTLLQLGHLNMDIGSREVWIDQKKIDLTNKEFDLLYLFASHPKQVFSRTQLLYKVWETEYDGDTTTVTVHIRRLREKIEKNPSNPTFIQTVWGIGYKYVTGDEQ
jgi:two-component system response regulator VicR